MPKTVWTEKRNTTNEAPLRRWIRRVIDQEVVFRAHILAICSYVILIIWEFMSPQGFLSDRVAIWLGMSFALYLMTWLLMGYGFVALNIRKLIIVIILHAVIASASWAGIWTALASWS